ncbi:hypothetical protein [Pseudoalteromonas piscicida]|uniref:hypothetical protein n=1 Tax=Pseudoalteromonas piscicida TaxID=43662 RepID=UPI001CB72619|nr:hypothetical protein [Pseudoalteromonas piscicida]
MTEQADCFPRQTTNLQRATNSDKATLKGVMRVVQPNWRDKYLFQAKASAYYQAQLGQQGV